MRGFRPHARDWRFSACSLLASMGALAALLPCVPARAGTSVAVSPARLEFQIDPGDARTQVVNFFNRNERSMVISAEPWDVRLGPGGKRVLAPPGSTPNSIASWFVITPPRLEIPGMHMGHFRVTVRVPDNGTGGFAAKLLFGSSAAASEDNTNSQMVFGVRLPVMVLVDTGTTEPAATVRLAEIHPPSVHEPLVAVVEVANQGTVHFFAETSIDLLGPMQDFVGHVVPELTKTLVLAGETQRIRLEWGGYLAPAQYEAVATVVFGRGGVAVSQAPFVVADVGATSHAGAVDAGAAPVSEVVLMPQAPPKPDKQNEDSPSQE